MPRILAVLFAFIHLCAASLLAQFAITNKPVTVRAMSYHTFTVTGLPAGSAIVWSVNGIVNGNNTVGTNSGARYNAPNFPPSPNTVTVTATVNMNPSLTDSATVNILNPFPNLASVNPATMHVGSYTVTLNGWGFVPGATVLMNGIARPATYVSSTRLTMAVSFKKSPQSDTSFQVVNPAPGSIASDVLLAPPPLKMTSHPVVSESAARRFLEQAAWGPDPYSIVHVRNLGFDKWIDEQIDEPISVYQAPALINVSNTPVQARFFTNAIHGRDQLRQRIAFALHKIWVVSGVDITTPPRLIPYLRIFPDLAFDNYRAIMRKVTLNPAMGEYLDMRNNVKANPARGTFPNENYGREFLQLFTIGLYQLNSDGSRQLNNGVPIPTYGQSTIGEFSRVFTGWTYPTMPGATPRASNPAYYEGDMVPWEPNHDTGAKTLLNGIVLPGGGSANQDLNAALDNAFNHPNVGPFIGKNLIQQLVTSNPSPPYVARVSAAFADNGLGVRGDMKAVIKAILLDAEARAGDDNPAPGITDGHLKEPVLFFAQTLRGLNSLVNDSNSLATRGNALGQNVFSPASVFSYFSPFFTAPNTAGLRGPEFQIHTRTSAIERANQINTLVYGTYGNGSTVDLTPWVTLAAAPSALADELDRVFLFGQMPSAFRTELMAAITGTPGTNVDKARAGLYVTLTSGYYAVKK